MPDLREKLQAALGPRFRVVRELTGGGMSRVFLATDEELEREVVAKILSPELIDEGRVDRFRQEVLQTARLQHPTIISILEVGAIEDMQGRHVPYYLMPYARGESLRSRMNHDGRLSVSVAMRVLRSVFDALAYAHAHGVVHRDIKPENIFLSGTNALLADFGIAKALAGPGSRSGATSPGMAVGTPSYMAPEQIVDGDAVGPRADLYAAGVVGYEMLAGRLPWGTLTPIEALASHARGRLVPLRSLRPDAPQAMAAMIEACLAFDADKRPESATAVLRALEAVPVTTPDGDTPASVPSVTQASPSRRPHRIAVGLAIAIAATVFAVVQFRSPAAGTVRHLTVLYPELPAGADNRALAERLYHSLTATLAPVSGLRLMSQLSVSKLADLGLSAAQIADSLARDGVDSMLAVEVAPSSGGAVLLSIELRRSGRLGGSVVAGPASFPSFAALSTTPPDSLAAVVRVLAAQVVARLNLNSASAVTSETRLIGAYAAWMSGRDAYARRTPAALREAITLFEQAVTLDSSYAQAHAELASAMALALLYHYRQAHAPYDMAVHALRHAERAVQLQPEFADGYLARGLLGTIAGAPVEYIEGNYAAAARLGSANPFSQQWYSQLLGLRGQFDSALARVEEEIRLNPRSPSQRVAATLYAMPARQYIVAVREATQARELVTERLPILAQVEIWGRILLGGESLAGCDAFPPAPYLGSGALCLERVGRAREARAMFNSLLAIATGAARADPVFDLSLYSGEMSTVYAGRGESARATQWLRQSFRESPAGIDYRLLRSGMFDSSTVAVGDSLRLVAWNHVREQAARADVQLERGLQPTSP